MALRLLCFLLILGLSDSAVADFAVPPQKTANTYDRENMWTKQPIKPQLEILLRPTIADFSEPSSANERSHLYSFAVLQLTASQLEGKVPDEVAKEWILLLILDCTADHTNESIHAQWLFKHNVNKLHNLPPSKIDYSKTPLDFATEFAENIMGWLNNPQ